MDTKRINRLYEKIHATIERKNKLLDKYKESNSSFASALASEINLLLTVVQTIEKLIDEINEYRINKSDILELEMKIQELEKELEITNQAYEVISEIASKNL